MSPSIGAIIALVLAGFLLVLSGFVSASEIAFFSLSPTDRSEIDEGKSEADKKINKLLHDSERLLATILIVNNLVNVTIVMLCNYFFLSVFHFKEGSEWLEFLIVTVALTFLLLLFGEIMPKIYSKSNPLKFARRAAGGISVFERLFRPFASLLVHSSVFSKKLVNKNTYTLSVEELEQALELTDKEEISEQQNMLEGIIRFGDEKVSDIMTPRMDMVMLEIKTPYSDVLKCVIENTYSRIPIYSDNQDNIKGVLYIKDLLPHLNKGNNFRWQTLIRQPFFVPETKKIDDLLRDFQRDKIHIAIVVDEFGGTSGMVSLEDILEEIVGEINDEFDDSDTLFEKIDEHTYVFEGKVLLSDFYKSLDLDSNQFDEIAGDADTLAGLLLEIKGEFPKLHEKLSCNGLEFEVLEMDTHRIVKVKVYILPVSND